MRAKGRSAFVGLGCVIAWVVSCVGDDPGSQPVDTDGGGASSSSGSGSSSGSPGDSGGDVFNPNCQNGNGVCGMGCNANNDDDCKPVCGNNVTEPGEVCDDGNT